MGHTSMRIVRGAVYLAKVEGLSAILRSPRFRGVETITVKPEVIFDDTSVGCLIKSHMPSEIKVAARPIFSRGGLIDLEKAIIRRILPRKEVIA